MLTYPAPVGLRIAFLPRISNAEAHAYVHIVKYTLMDIGACFTMQQDNEFAKFTEAADKTLAQRLSYYVCHTAHHNEKQCTTRQKYKKYVQGK